MIEVKQEVLRELQTLQRGAEAVRQSSGEKVDFQAIFKRLDDLAEKLSGEESQLKHYLQRKSYDKALKYLEESTKG